MTPEPPFEQSPDYVQSLARGLLVLRAFDHDMPQGSLSEVAERTGLSRAVARRHSLGLGRLAQQAMEKLAQDVDESSSMSVLDGSEIVYVLRVPVRRVMSIALGVGARLPAFAASMGRVMLADLPEPQLNAWLRNHKFRSFTNLTLHTANALKAELQRVRSQGYALVSQELELGLCSIAVPIRAASGRVVAGLNVSMQYSDGVRERAVQTVLPALRDTQQAIEQAIVRGGSLPLLEMRHASA